FEGFHVQEAEKAMVQSASKISMLVEEHDEKPLIREMVERVKDSTSRVIIYFEDGEMWASNTTNKHLLNLDAISPENNPELKKAVEEHRPYNEKMTILEDESEIMVIGIPEEKKGGTIFVFQSLDVINQTKAET